MKSFTFFISRVFLFSITIVIIVSMYLCAQIQTRVNLTADKYEIQLWEKVNIKATLNPNSNNFNYTFFINNKRVPGANKNELKNYEFQEPGTYIIKVNARFNNTGDDVGITILTDSITIKVRKVDLSVSPQVVFTGDNVTVKLGYKLPENNVKYRFYFGDNSQSKWLQESITSHTYEHNGIYRVYCEIGKFDGAALYDSIYSTAKRVRVNIKPSYEVRLSVPGYVIVDEDIVFKADPITNVPNQSFKFQFNFGDNSGTNAQPQNDVKHSFKKTGTFTAKVRLLSTENKLLAESNSVIIKVQELEIPQQDISLIVNPIEVEADEDVNFKLELRKEFKNLRFRFYYGDGLSPSLWLVQPRSSYKYKKPDVYKVSAEVGRFDGNTVQPIVKSETKQIKVNPYFRINLSAKNSAQVDEVIKFKANVSTNAVDQDFKFLFMFSDDTEREPQSENEIEHSFKKKGIYKAAVKLLTTENNLIAESNVVDIVVEDLVIPPQSISFTVDPIEVNADEDVIFKIIQQTEYQNLRYRFYYGEGLPPSHWLETSESSYRYEKPNVYEVYAEVGRFNGDSVYSLVKTESRVVKVNPFIELQLSSNTTVGVNEETIIKAETSTNIENPEFRYLFDFGDSHHTEPQFENTTKHSYNKKGKYTVSVKLLDAHGKILRSQILIINVDGTNNLWLIILIVLAVLTGGSLTIKYLLVPKIKFKSHFDAGKNSISKEKESLIELTIRLNPKTDEAKFYIDNSDKKLVKNIRRKHE